MWVFFILLITILGVVHFWYIKHDFINPTTVFLFVWAIVVLMASLQLYDLMETSDRVYAYICLGVAFFYIGSIFGNRTKFVIGQVGRERKQYTFEINYTILIIVSIVIIIYSAWRLTNVLSLLNSGNSWMAIRLMGTSGESGAGTLKGGSGMSFLHDAVVAPLLYLAAPTALVDLFVGKRKKLPIILTLIAVTLYSVATVSRAIWAFLILYAVAIVFLYRGKYKLPDRIRKAFRFVPLMVIALVVVIIGITVMRSANGRANIMENAYAYICGALPLFSVHLEEGISSIRTFGMLSANGFLYPIFFVLNYFHILSYPEAFTNAISIKDNLETYVTISPQITMNAFTTLFYDFYIDFGIIGIAVLSFVFGMLCIKAYNAFRNNGNVRNLVLYLIILQFIVFSVARIYTSLSTRALSLIWLFILFKRVYYPKEEEAP